MVVSVSCRLTKTELSATKGLLNDAQALHTATGKRFEAAAADKAQAVLAELDKAEQLVVAFETRSALVEQLKQFAAAPSLDRVLQGPLLAGQAGLASDGEIVQLLERLSTAYPQAMPSRDRIRGRLFCWHPRLKRRAKTKTWMAGPTLRRCGGSPGHDHAGPDRPSQRRDDLGPHRHHAEKQGKRRQRGGFGDNDADHGFPPGP